MKSYIEQIADAYVEGNLEKAMEIEEAGAENITKAFVDVIETIPPIDLPFAIVALRNLQKTVERLAGEDGTKVANDMMQHLVCIDISTLPT